jgi:predicted RNA binding protein YcfA (HicA-like mRNA interferase family)
MTKKSKLINKILSGKADQSITFNELVKVLELLNFESRIKGSHYIFYKDEVEEIINIQAKKDNKAKAYQVKQVRDLIHKYNLYAESDEI